MRENLERNWNGWLWKHGKNNFFLLVYKILKFRRHFDLYSRFEQYFSKPTRDLRSNVEKIFDLFFSNSAVFDSMSQSRAISLWNALSNDVVESDSVYTFGNNLINSPKKLESADSIWIKLAGLL